MPPYTEICSEIRLAAAAAALSIRLQPQCCGRPVKHVDLAAIRHEGFGLTDLSENEAHQTPVATHSRTDTARQPSTAWRRRATGPGIELQMRSPGHGFNLIQIPGRKIPANTRPSVGRYRNQVVAGGQARLQWRLQLTQHR